MSILDDLKKVLDDLIGAPPNQNVDGYTMPDFGSSGAGRFNPDTIKKALQDQGYAPAEIDRTLAQFDDQTYQTLLRDRPEPFTTLDINAIDSQFIAGADSSQSVPQGSYQVAGSTAKKIFDYLGLQNITPNISTTNPNTNPITIMARTVTLPNPGNFLRVERLPPGNTTAQNGNPGYNSSSFIGPVKDQTHLFDTVVSFQNGSKNIPNAAALAAGFNTNFTGIFVQFDSIDNPIFCAKHLETYTRPYTQVFITYFVNDLRWRVIGGVGAEIQGSGSERILRQNLFIGESSILDQNSAQYTPFSITNSLVNYAYRTNPNFSQMLSNSDDGSGIVATSGSWPNATGGGMGKVTNKGYGVCWITGIDIDVTQAPTASPNGVYLNFILYKGWIDRSLAPIGNFTRASQILYQKFIPLQATNTQQNSFSVDFNTPIRVVLAGFDCQPWLFTSSKVTGENLYCRTIFDNLLGSAPTGNIIVNFTIRGYALGWVNTSNTNSQIACLPYNPYPNDCLNSFPTPV